MYRRTNEICLLNYFDNFFPVGVDAGAGQKIFGRHQKSSSIKVGLKKAKHIGQSSIRTSGEFGR